MTNFSLIKELPSTKLHTLLLDHQNTKLTWFIDWPKKEVLFNVDEAFADDTEWFAFGFSQRGQIANSDMCYFVRSIYDEAYNEAIVSIIFFPSSLSLSVFFFVYPIGVIGVPFLFFIAMFINL